MPNSDKIVYKPIPLEHLDAYFDLLNDESLAVNAGSVPYPASKEWAKERLEQRIQGEKDGTMTDRGLYIDGTLVGSSGFFFREHGLEIGYGIHRDHRGKGLATIAARLAVQSAREMRHKGPISANYFKDNPASGRVLEKVGFKIIGDQMGQSAARDEQTPSWCAQLTDDVAFVETIATDIPEIHALQREKNGALLAGVPGEFLSLEAFSEGMEAALSARTAGQLIYTVLVEGNFAGYVGIFLGEAGNQSISFWISEAFWGRGIGTEAVTHVLENAPKVCLSKPLFAAVVEGNGASMRILERHGFEPFRKVPFHSAAHNAERQQILMRRVPK